MIFPSPRRCSRRDLARYCIVPLTLLFFLYLYTSSHQHSSEVVTPRQPLTEYELTSGNGSLSQDDPRLLDHILNNVLLPPSPKGKGVDVNWTVVTPIRPSAVEGRFTLSKYILDLFNQKTGGSFIECGANDGEFLSNTMFLEKDFGWGGLLVEVDPDPLKILVNRNRNAWIAQSCLSKGTQPIRIQFLYHDFGMSSISAKLDHNATPRSTFLAQCFPLYSILLAIGRTTIDYFAMDMEDSELGVLQSIPWDKVVIKVLSIEVHPQYVEPVLNYMTSIGYLYIKFMKFAYTSDQVYVHRDFLAELNQTLLQAEGL